MTFDTSLENRSAPLSSLLPTRSVMVLSKTCLSICKQIVTLHGGTITASSQLDEKTTFNVVLPA